MPKSTKKKGRGRQKSNAAIETAKKREEQAESTRLPSDAEMVEYSGQGGMMTRMRGGFQSAVGQSDGSAKKGGILSNVIWILVIAALAFLAMGDMR